jgi:DNA topoisomerase-1
VDVDGRARALRSGHVNAYLRAAAGADGGGEATAKTFRTWAATVLACAALARAQTGQAGNDEPSSHTASGRRRRSSAALRAAIDEVAAHLGDTPTVARQAYVHPAVIEAEGDGSLDAAAARVRRRGRAQGRVGLSPDERLTLAVLRSATRPRPGDVV